MPQIDHSDSKVKFEYNKINQYIYIGTNMCCLTHFSTELLKKGISADISLEKEKLDAPFGVKSFVWLPVKDKTAPSLEQLQIGIAALDQLIALKQKVYVHCKNGHGRAPTLVLAYFIKQGLSYEQALDFLKKKRSSIHLESSQIKRLQAYAKLLAK